MARGHLRRRTDGAYSIVLYLGKGEDGKKKYKWATVRGTKKEAQAEMTRLLREIDTGVYVDTGKVTVAGFLTRWLTDYSTPNCGEKTTQEYRKLIHGHVVPRMGSLELAKVNAATLQRFYAELLESGRKDGKGGLSGRTVLHVHRVLHEAFGHAVKWQVLARNPCEVVDTPKAEKKRIKPPDAAAVVLLLETVQAKAPTLYGIILAAVCTGLRRAEILALRWCDVDLVRRVLTVNQSASQTVGKLTFKAPKSETSQRMVAMPSMLVEELVRHRGRQAERKLALGPDYQDHDLIFVREDGGPRSLGSFSNMFSEFIRRSGLPPLRFHDLRHSYASQLLRQGVPLKTVSAIMGHSGISITADTYGHLLGGEERDAADKLEAVLVAAMEGR